MLYCTSCRQFTILFEFQLETTICTCLFVSLSPSLTRNNPFLWISQNGSIVPKGLKIQTFFIMNFLKKGFEIRYKTGKQGWRPVVQWRVN